MILRCGYCACLGDYLCGLLGGCVVEKLLSRLRELCAVLGNEDERTLNFVAAVLDGGLARSNSVYFERLYGVLYGGERSVAYGVGILRYRCDNVAGRGQLLAVFALVLCAGCRLEAVSCSASRLAAYKNDFAVFSAELLPVGYLAGVYLGYLFNGEIGYDV